MKCFFGRTLRMLFFVLNKATTTSSDGILATLSLGCSSIGVMVCVAVCCQHAVKAQFLLGSMLQATVLMWRPHCFVCLVKVSSVTVIIV